MSETEKKHAQRWFKTALSTDRPRHGFVFGRMTDT